MVVKEHFIKNQNYSSQFIIFEINGGIGNQIFQLASSYCFAIKTGRRIILDTRGCDSANSFHGSWHLDLLVKEMQKELPIRITRSNNLVKIVKRKVLDFIHKPTMIAKTEIVIQYMRDEPFEELGKYVFIPTIEDRFLAKEALSLGFGKFFNRIQFHSEPEFNYKVNLVGVHVRRSDAIGTDRLVPDSWFTTVLNEFLNRNILLFTDSVEKLSFLSTLNTSIFVFGPEMHPLESIICLSKCEVLVLSKSTFSFWAAAISDSKKIITPLSPESPYVPLGSHVNYVPI